MSKTVRRLPFIMPDWAKDRPTVYSPAAAGNDRRTVWWLLLGVNVPSDYGCAVVSRFSKRDKQ